MEGRLNKKVWVNGAFDVLHIGHIRLLQFASGLGQLRVGIDTDSRIKQLKGENRPFNTLQDRIEFLLSLKCVDMVTVFDSNEELIDKIKIYSPDYWFIFIITAYNHIVRAICFYFVY